MSAQMKKKKPRKPMGRYVPGVGIVQADMLRADRLTPAKARKLSAWLLKFAEWAEANQ